MNEINLEKYAKQIAEVIAKDISSFVCDIFCGEVEGEEVLHNCNKCALKGVRCSNVNAVYKWLFQESEEKQ